MRDIPDCMNRRYQALDELIAELTTIMSDQGSLEKCGSESNDASVKLMCEFWNILKEDPDCNLTEIVQQRMGLKPKSSRSFRPQRLACYMASRDNCCRDNKNVKKQDPEPKDGCCSSSSKSVSPRSTSETVPLSKVLCNLKEAVSFDKKCNERISELMATQQQLQDQIQGLEEREREGTQMLKQADCMWSCMEDTYKKKVAETLQRQNGLLKQIKEIETSNTKWRKNKKDLEFQLGNVNKCYEEIKLKLQEKAGDVKCIKMEADSFTKRAETNKKETAAVKKSFANKKNASNAKIASMSAEITRIRQKVYEEQAHKREKELEGSKHVKEAREDLQKIYRVLLQKKLENEDLRAEKEAIIQEIDLLRKTCDLCKDKCRIKHETLIDEITKVDAEIAGYKVRCIKCHECTDTGDTRKCCIDCPRCAEERDCLYEEGRCTTDVTMDCVCMSTKQKFIDNVFDNMYTVLERQAKTPPGKAVADAVLECLKRSRNGKLNDETKKILQDFVLTTVKKNLNLTIIGGAVKTRCEMDPETYQQLMLCLKQVKTAPPPKEDKATVPKKDPCSRWGGTSECNCPKGPKSCICGKKAPPPPNEPDTCPPSQDNDDAGKALVCPHNKESAACGADCAMHAVPSAVGTDVAAWRPAPCSEKHCSFSKNMRAAQCFLGPDSLTSASKTKNYKSKLPYVPDMSVLKNQITCKCGPTPTNPCECRKELKCHPRERIIEEVMGRYTDVTPIEKVTTLDDNYYADLNMGENKRICSNASVTEVLKLNISKSRMSQLCACSSSYISEDITPYKKILQEKKLLYICTKRKDQGELNKEELYKNFQDFQFQSSRNVKLGIKSDEKIAILSCPLYSMQFVDRSVGSEENLPSTRQSSNKAIVTMGPTTLKEDDIKNRIQTFGVTSLITRYVEKTVKNIIKDVMILDTSMSRVNRKSSSVEWITVESFLKEISTITHPKKNGSDTINNKMDRQLLNENIVKLLNKQTQTKQTLIKTYSKKIETCSASESDSISGSTICFYVSESFENSSLNSTENG